MINIKTIKDARKDKVANQLIIVRQPSEKEEPYHPITEKEMITAGKLLSGKALAVWGLYALQKDNYPILSGAKNIRNKGLDITSTGYNKIIQRLKQCGYITQDPHNKDIYHFWTLPQNEKNKPEEENDHYQAQFLTMPPEETNRFKHITTFGSTPRDYYDDGELPF